VFVGVRVFVGVLVGVRVIVDVRVTVEVRVPVGVRVIVGVLVPARGAAAPTALALTCSWVSLAKVDFSLVAELPQ
jgi:hypothetical protein